MFQRLPIALVKLKAGNTSENLLKEVRKTIYSLCRTKQISKTNSKQIKTNSKTSDPHRLLVNLSDKINLKRSDKYVALSNLSIYYAWKKVKVIQK